LIFGITEERRAAVQKKKAGPSLGRTGERCTVLSLKSVPLGKSFQLMGGEKKGPHPA